MAIAKQNGRLIGKIKNAKLGKKGTTKNGKEFQDYQFNMELKTGVSVLVMDRVYNPENPPVFIGQKMDLYDDIISRHKDEEIYVQKQIKPTKDKKTKIEKMSFDKVESYRNDNGEANFSIKGGIQVLDHATVGEDVVLTFQGANGPYTQSFSDTKAYFDADMIISSIDEDTREFVLSDGSDDYPLTLIGKLNEKMPIKGATVGQGYKFRVEFEKGKKVEKETVADDYDIWNSEAKAEKSQFTPNTLILSPTGLIKDLKTTIKTKSYGNASTQSSDGLPF